MDEEEKQKMMEELLNFFHKKVHENEAAIIETTSESLSILLKEDVILLNLRDDVVETRIKDDIAANVSYGFLPHSACLYFSTLIVRQVIEGKCKCKFYKNIDNARANFNIKRTILGDNDN